MMIWNYFAYFAITAVLLWVAGAAMAWTGRKTVASWLSALGLAVFCTYLVWMWITLERPPMRTMGETRLWYSFFLPLIGLVIYVRKGYKWVLSFSTLLATVFICVNLFKPEIHTKTMMPALQSPWFTPHVIVYMMAYAMLGATAVAALYLLFFKKGGSAGHSEEMDVCDDLVRVGLAFLTFGMIFGAFWAKEAWGTYWGWDPKETWAAITWLGYLVYIHFRLARPKDTRTALWMIIIGFVLLQVCWWGINYLPSARATSVHTY